MRFDCVIGVVADLRATSTCSSLTDVPERHSRVYHVENGLKISLRPCSFVPDWWVGTIPIRIASLIYINFD
jgi:hypothetical protein